MGLLSLTVRAYVVAIAIAAVGLLCAGYVLVHQGGGPTSPWANTYEIKVEFSGADGVVGGIGQPVDVAGVDVGSIVDTDLQGNGRALVTMRIRRDELPHVYADATAALRPITPLDDMRIELSPGAAPAAPLHDGATLGIRRTSSPVDLNDVLAALDGDARSHLAGLIEAVDQGTRDRGQGMRRALLALGPPARQMGRITSALAERRTQLARLVHNLAEVTHAASRDGQLDTVVRAGNATLRAVASQDSSLRRAIGQLPATTASVSRTLGSAATLARHLQPAARALVPPARKLPATLASLRPFARTSSKVIGRELRPLVRQAQPVVGDLGSATPRLAALAPDITHTLRSTNYLLNTVAHNPDTVANGDPDEGGLFWLSWFAHNWNSVFSLSDANGVMGRATMTHGCLGVTGILETEINAVLGAAMGLKSLCPK